MIDFLVRTMNVNKPTRAEMRQGLEKKVLTLALADAYGRFPARLAVERGITFTPMPNWNVDRNNPACNSCLLSLDHDANDPSPQKGNLMLPDNDEGKNLDVIFYDSSKLKTFFRLYTDGGPSIRSDQAICGQNKPGHLWW